MANLHQLLLYGRPKAPFLPRVRHHQIRPFSLEVEGARLHGWLAMPRGPVRGAMLYFNGRRESPTTVFRFLDVLEHQAVAVFHYRGLGPSSGSRVSLRCRTGPYRCCDRQIVIGRTIEYSFCIRSTATYSN